MKEDLQNSTTPYDEISSDTGQDSTTIPETSKEESINNNEEKSEHERSECNKGSIHKHGILQLLGENVSCTIPPKKKLRRERKSVEHSIVKQNQSSSFQPFDQTKRKTKKMGEMLDFLERERNVSLLDDICKSRFGGFRKKSKRSVVSSDKPSFSPSYSRVTYPFSSESVELDTCKIDSIDKSPKQSDISHFYPNLRECEEKTRLKDISDIDADSYTLSTPPQESSSNICSTSSETIASHLEISKYDWGFNDAMECDESLETKLYNPTLIKNEIEIEDNTSCLNEEDESPVLNLQISDIKGSAWIEPDGYTSDESALVIDEGINTRETSFGDGENQDCLFKKTKNLENISSEGEISIAITKEGPLQTPEFQSKINVEEKTLKLEPTSDSVVADSHNSNEYRGRSNADSSSLIHIQSPSHSDKIKAIKNINNYNKSDNCYVIEDQQEVKQSEDSLQHSSFLKDAPIRKIKLKKVNKKKENYICDTRNISSSSSKRNENTEICGLNNSSTDCRFSEEDVIIDCDNYIETQKNDSKTKHPESDVKFRSISPHILCDASEQIVSSSNVDSVSSSKIDSGSSSNQSSSCHQQKDKQQTEFTVLRRHLESGDHSRKYTMSRDPRTSKTSFSRVEPYILRAQANERNTSNGNQMKESLFFLSDSDILYQNPLGEFNKAIYVMYKELLTPLSQNFIGQLTEILYLVISESVRYSDRCRKAKRQMSAEIVIREQVSAHRDFQANTIFYGMYFTHLFKNVVQCFPASKEFHTFMYLALFVNLFRRLKSIYNVHSSYLHIARKLVVSMLKANMYDDIIIFSAICKPDPVFETDFVMVSQLIDSFAEYMKTLFPSENNYLLHVPQYNYNLQPPSTPVVPNMNIIHPEFPPVRVNVAPIPVIPTQTTPKSQSHSVTSQTKFLVKEESHLQSDHRILSKNMKLTSSRDPRAYAYSSELETRNSGKSRHPFFLVAKPHTPVTQATPTVHSLLPTPTSIPLSVPTSTSASTLTATPTPTLIASNTSTSTISIPRIVSTTASTSTPMSSPTVSSKSSNTGKTQPETSPIIKLSVHDQSQSSGVHVWRPTAIRPRFRPCLPYYPSAPLFQCVNDTSSNIWR